MIVQTRPKTTGGLPSTKSDELMFTNLIWEKIYVITKRTKDYISPPSPREVALHVCPSKIPKIDCSTQTHRYSKQLIGMNFHLFALKKLEGSVAVAEKVWSSQIPVLFHRLVCKKHGKDR